MSFPPVGRQAPDFALPNQHGETVRLSDFTGSKHVVLYFYPKAMTPGCTTQACGIRDAIADIDALNAVVLGVSPDPVARLGRFIDKQGLNFDLLSDEELEVAKQYGVWGLKKFMGREFMGILRTTFVIGRDGQIKHVMDKVKTKTHHEEVTALLEKLE